jgi:hypothetical protein
MEMYLIVLPIAVHLVRHRSNSDLCANAEVEE